MKIPQLLVETPPTESNISLGAWNQGEPSLMKEEERYFVLEGQG